MNLSINLNNLSGEGYAALILGIIFTIATIASAIFFAKHKDANKVVTALAAFVFPALSVFCWAYLILIVCSVEVKWSLVYALVCAVGYVIVAVAVSYIIYAIIKTRANRPVKVEEPAPEPVQENTEEVPVEETANLTEEETTETEEVPEEQEKIEDAPTTLLLSHTEEPEEQTEEVEEVVEEEETPEQTEEAQTEETAEETEEVVAETEEADEENSDENDETAEGVIFTKEPKVSFAEQLNALSEEMIGYYNEILEYAKTKDISMVKESRSHVIVKMGRMRLVEFKFNRGKLVCRFMAGSSELKNYSMAEKAVKIKEKPVMIEIENENSVAVAKNMIDIVCKNIMEAREAKEAEEVIPPVTDEVPVETNDEE